MTSKHLFVLLLALFASAVAQSADELQIPDENDNQFPPDNHAESDGTIVEGSGAGTIDEPLETTADSSVPLLEDVIKSTSTDNIATTATEKHLCPKPCVCNIEGGSNKYIVDCSGYELTEVPKPLDPKTTELNLQNNKITQIPKDVSALKELKVLNANNNDIMEIISGSISELPELTTLKLANNRLLEFPQDLKNSFGLTKLEELDLGGNDMRTALTSESFSNFKSLRSLTLPTSSSDLVQDLCTKLKESLETVCTESCKTKTFDCPEAPHGIEDDLLNYALPGLISLGSTPEETAADPAVNPATDVKTAEETNAKTSSAPKVESTEGVTTEVSSDSRMSQHSVVIKTPLVSSESTSETTTKPDAAVVGATTVDSKTGGVDKSVIGIVVAGMVLVVAGITIKKNWSSIRNRFSSSNNANDRTGTAANGTTPEEVPLQEKSPV